MFSGLQEAVLKNIDACKELSLLTKSSMGPNGEQRIVSVSHIPCTTAVFTYCNHGAALSPCGNQSTPSGHCRLHHCVQG